MSGPESTNPSPYSAKKEGVRLVIDGIGFGVVTGLEVFRAGLVNTKISLERSITGDEIPILDPNSTLSNILQNGGDFYDGFWISLATYNLVTGIDYILSRFTKRYMPQRVKLGFSMLAAVGGVVAYESGKLSQFLGGTFDPSDIPAGLLGAAAYLGVNYLARSYTEARR
ncbi:hypothetical protein HYW42_03050 [Candidatus Daviesbacteria bacterium]|nr:hypothetical protein [Candidatus Daviesbacteria bacterium]